MYSNREWSFKNIVNCMMEYYSAGKRNKLLMPTTTRMNLKILLNKRIHAQKSIYCMIPLIVNSRKSKLTYRQKGLEQAPSSSVAVLFLPSELSGTILLTSSETMGAGTDRISGRLTAMERVGMNHFPVEALPLDDGHLTQ